MLFELFLILLFIFVIAWTSFVSKGLLNPPTVVLVPFVFALALVVLDPTGREFIHLSGASFLAYINFALVLSFPYLMWLKKASIPASAHSQNNSFVSSETSFASAIPSKWTASVLLLVGCGAYLMKVHSHFDILDLLSFYEWMTTDVILKENTMRDGWSVLHWTGLLGLIYSGIVLGVGKISKLSKIILLSLSFLYVTTLIGLFMKKWVVIGILLFLFSYCLTGKSNNLRMILMVSAFGLILVSIHNFLRSGEIETAINYIISYVTSPVLVFDSYLTADNYNHFPGAYSGGAIITVIEQLGFETNIARFNEFFVYDGRGSTSNVGTILRDLRLDFGVLGGYAGLLGLSFISFASHRLYLYHCSCSSVVLYSVVLTVCFMSFFGGLYKDLFIIYVIGLHFLISMKIIIFHNR